MRKALLAACGVVCLLCITAFVKNGLPAAGEDEKMIALRSIGNAVLRQAGDYTSNLPPIKREGGNAYTIQFANPLTFITDSLVAATSAALEKTGLTNDYTLKVINKATGETAYGYKVARTPGASVIPCLGRVQPKAEYSIIISFGKPNTMAVLLQGYTLPSLGLLLTLLSAAILMFYNKKPMTVAETGVIDSGISIGRYKLLPENGELKLGNESIALTAKEIKVLTLFAQQPGTVITRQQLVDLAWGDEGVVVGGRSLDVFISKLRKKFTGDAQVSFVNIHGVGYKLQVE